MEPVGEEAGTRQGWRHPVEGRGRALQRRDHRDEARLRARGLGWLSLGLGMARLASPRAPGAVGPRLGGRWGLLPRVMAVRELALGLGLLRWRSARWLWARVAGDLMDLALLGRTLRARHGRGRIVGTMAAVAGMTAIDVATGVQLGRRVPARSTRTGAVATRSITVACAPAEAYRFWRELPNLPRFMPVVQSVRPLDERRSRWTVRLPGGGTVQWTAEIVEDRPGERIAWRSLPDSQVNTAGKVRFVEAPGGRGTEIRAELRYAPAWHLGRGVARLLRRGLQERLASDLRRLKQVLETGEILHSDASIHPGRHPARPAADADTLTDDVGADDAGWERP
jgi:uncharacterized membrane protein